MSRDSKGGRRSLLQMDLSDIGRRRRSPGDEDAPDHAPFAPRLPTVDLLPRSVRDSVRIGRLRRAFILGLALILAASAGVWVLQDGQIAEATADVERAQATNDQVRQDLEALGPVRRMYEQITRLQGIVTDTLAAQPQSAFVIDQVVAAGVREAAAAADFSSIDVVYSGIPAAGGQLNPCPNPDPFGSPIAIGCVTFTASTASRVEVSQLLRNLEENPLFVGPYVTTSTASVVEGESDSVSFTGSAGVSLDGLVTALTPEQVDALLNPPQEDAAATTEPGPDDGAPADGAAGAVDETGASS